jgi:phosphatidylglycerol---prolipoprotein diacylglyceryl transferase
MIWIVLIASIVHKKCGFAGKTVMNPLCFKIGALSIHWYGVMMAFGFMAGLANWVQLGRKEGRDFNFCSDLLFWVMVSGVVGARLAFVAGDWEHFSKDLKAIVRVDQGGLIFYGGLISAAAVLFFFARSRKQPFSSLVDFVITSVPVAHAFGRVGCFLNGCCFGAPSGRMPGVCYPGDTVSLAWRHHVAAGLIQADAARSLPVHPVQLYEAALNVVLFLCLRYLYPRRRWNGQVVVAYMCGYAAVRFATETLRGDRGQRMQYLGLSSAQWVSLALLAVAAGIYAWFNTRKAPVSDAA